MELTLDLRPSSPQTSEDIINKLDDLTRQFSAYALSCDVPRKQGDLDKDPMLRHFSPHLVFRSNKKDISGRDAYVKFHQAVLRHKPQMVFRPWDTRVDLAEGGDAAHVWMTADLCGFDGGQRLECTFVYYWKRLKKGWLCDRIGGLTSMGGFSHALY